MNTKITADYMAMFSFRNELSSEDLLDILMENIHYARTTSCALDKETHFRAAKHCLAILESRGEA